MTIPEVKIYLKGYYDAQQDISAKEDKIKALESQMQKVTPAYSMAPCGGGVPDSMAESVAAYVDLKESFAEDVALLEQTAAAVCETIGAVRNHRLKIILTWRYINFKKWEQVAVLTGLSWTQTHRLHKVALQEVKKILERQA